MRSDQFFDVVEAALSTADVIETFSIEDTASIEQNVSVASDEAMGVLIEGEWFLVAARPMTRHEVAAYITG